MTGSIIIYFFRQISQASGPHQAARELEKRPQVLTGNTGERIKYFVSLFISENTPLVFVQKHALGPC
jgi:hypothetical protein